MKKYYSFRSTKSTLKDPKTPKHSKSLNEKNRALLSWE